MRRTYTLSACLALVAALTVCWISPADAQVKSKRTTKKSSLNKLVLDYAHGKLGQQVGNGECWTLAFEALKDAGAKRPGQDGLKVSELVKGRGASVSNLQRVLF